MFITIKGKKEALAYLNWVLLSFSVTAYQYKAGDITSSKIINGKNAVDFSRKSYFILKFKVKASYDV